MIRNLDKCRSKKTFLLNTPIGKLEIFSCSIGLHKISIDKRDNLLIHKNESVFLIENLNDNEQTPDVILETIEYFKEYFGCMDTIKKLPNICWESVCRKNSFTEKVLKGLCEITNKGTKLSYKELATLCGNSKASRAVGTVMRRNPIPLLIPCHRVIKSDESLGNYSGGSGVDLKKWLLEHETRFAKK
jgi:methylated-DNA-[protein]-cysteine S-methyltransferase